MKRILSFLSVLLLSATFALAQKMSVSAPSEVYVGDQINVKFTVDANAKEFQGPSFKDLKRISGPSSSFFSSTSINNGQLSKSVTTTFSYLLIASEEGTYTIGPASCTVDGKKISSESFTIKVVKMSAQVQQQRQAQQQQQQQRRQAFDPWDNQPTSEAQLDESMLFVRTSASKTSPYVGEQVIVTYKVFTQVGINQFELDKLPGNKGFWAEDLSVGQRVKQYDTVYNGRTYRVCEIRRGALFAQESGPHAIEPIELNVQAMVQRPRRQTGSIWDIFDDPFFNTAQAVNRQLKSNRIPVNVRPLPPAPSSFDGAVGRFSIKGGLNLDHVKANEAVTYRLTLSGSGNLMLIGTPQPEFPSAFEVYDPQIEDNIHRSDGGISGSRTYEWVLIPRTKGNYEIPAFSYSYFDPSSGSYTILSIPAQSLVVEHGDSRQSSFSSKDDVKLLAEDINYIHPVSSLRPLKEKEHAGLAFWLILALVVAATVAAFLISKKIEASRLDVAGTRMRRATRQAQKRLKKAASFLGPGNTDRFYEEIYRAIWGCLADKYTIPLSRLNRDTVLQCLSDRSVPPAQQDRIMQVLHDVDMARFAPGDPEAMKKNIYTEALIMIAEL